MKKVLALIISLTLMLFLVACGGETDNTLTEVTDTTKSVSSNNNSSSSSTKSSSNYSSSSLSNYSSSKQSITHYCEAGNCTREGTKKYEGYAGTEYYCETHYNELMKMLGIMESDVGSGAYSNHQCEVCSKEGTHEIIGLSGQKEYYCSEHYYEMKEWIDAMK